MKLSMQHNKPLLSVGKITKHKHSLSVSKGKLEDLPNEYYGSSKNSVYSNISSLLLKERKQKLTEKAIYFY